MSAGALRIEPMAKSHLKDIARLHVMALTKDFSGWAGRGIMELFYREVIATHHPPPGFVALLGDRVVGFAVAVENAATIKKRVLLRWGWWLAVLAAVQALTRPRALIERVRRRAADRPAQQSVALPDALEVCCPPPRIEFRGIVVDPAAHVPGAALGLMRARLAWAKAAGYKSIYFRIEPGNERSIKLCQWAGAQPVPETVPQRRRRFYKLLA